MSTTDLRNALKAITDRDYDVDTALMALLLLDYKLIELIKERFGSNFVSYLLDEVEYKIDSLDSPYDYDVIDCALNNLTALKAIALYESRESSSELCRESQPSSIE